MKDRAAILKILSVQTFLLNNDKIALYLGIICEYGLIGLKTTPFSLEMFSYVKNTYSLLGSLKGPTTDWATDRSTNLHKSGALNLHSRSRILTSILKVRFDKFNLR